MALTRVQSTSGINNSFVTSTTTSAFGSSTTSGNMIVVGIMTESGSATNVSSVTDSKSNSYSRVISSNHGTGFMESEIWVAYNITGGASHTVTANYGGGGVRCVVEAEEVSGAATSNAADQSAANHATGTGTLTATTAATTQANEFVYAFGILSTGSGTSWTLGSGYSNLVSCNGTGTGVAAESAIVSATGTQTATLSSSITNQTWGMLVATFADTPIGGGGGTTVKTLAALGVG